MFCILLLMPESDRSSEIRICIQADGNIKLFPGDEVTVIGRQDDVAKVAKGITAGGLIQSECSNGIYG